MAFFWYTTNTANCAHMPKRKWFLESRNLKPKDSTPDAMLQVNMQKTCQTLQIKNVFIWAGSYQLIRL